MPAKESDSRLPRQHFSPETAQSSQYTAPPRIRDCERFPQGWALAVNGQEEGVERLISGLSATRATGAGINNTATLALLAEIYLQKSRFGEGLATIEDALK